MTLATGLNELDTLLDGGFKPGELITISGLPAIGKTSLAFQLIHNVCARDPEAHVFLATFEMHQKEATRRLLALASNLCMSDVIGGSLTPEQLAHLKQTSVDIRDWHVWVRSDLHRIDEVIENTRELHEHNHLALLIVDYLQMMYADRDSQRLHAHTPEHGTVIAKALKDLAQELQIPVVVVAPFTRDIIETETTTPTLAALRKSGMLVFYSDVVIFLHHLPEHPTMDKGFEMNMRVIARRKKIETDIPVFFEPELVKFSSLEVG